MVRSLTFTLFIILCAGCGSTNKPDINWFAEKNIDKFDDSFKCRVTVGSTYYSSGTVLTYNAHYYPFIEKVNDELRVGILSGGKVKVPVGDVQMRIDSNPAWTIETSETPVDYTTPGASMDMSPYMANMTPEQKTQFQTVYKQSLNNTTKMMSPFTASTGEKAEKILKQMVGGSKLIYRVVGFNQAASSTGEYPLDITLTNALTECGITI